MSRLQVAASPGKETLLRDWVRRRLGDVDHELRVAHVAKSLFNLTQRWHGLGSAESKLLLLAALAHDVGRVSGEKKHAQRGARMLLEGRGLALSETDRRRLAYLTRYHKGQVPQAGAEEILHHENAGHDQPDNAYALRVLLGLLRAADALDSRSMGGPRLVMTIRNGRGRELAIFAYVEGDAVHAAQTYAKPKKLRLLQEMLRCNIRIHWVGTREMTLVG